ncbi:sugar ABC transporter permease [Georgenia sp. H159]|uniref:carbohydrate ABC transporter permease n=1 Tax=Georgenia sp. H159 TaxID=3076115 RepID=UPI002D786D32|nr:sugar ABC transporter permease [Georgenia sp. H159]
MSTAVDPSATDTDARSGPHRHGRGLDRAYYWMVLPAFVLFFVLHTIPVLQGIFYSFTDSPGYGAWNFVGLSNYTSLFSDPRVVDAYIFTFKFALITTVLVNVIGLAIAIGLNSRIKLKNTLRGVYFIPYVLALLVIGYVFSYMFNQSLPTIGQALGIEALSSSLLADPELAWIGIVIMTVWQGAAFTIIIYLAGLQTVPGELYEAAAIDGATPWRQFWSITMPMIWGFFTINVVLALKNFLQVFDQIIAMTGGGPGTSTESIGVLIYRGGFEGGEYGYQLANAVLFMIVIIAFAFFQLRVLRREEVSA